MSTICGVLAVTLLAFLSDALPDTGGGGTSSMSLSFFTSQKISNWEIWESSKKQCKWGKQQKTASAFKALTGSLGSSSSIQTFCNINTLQNFAKTSHRLRFNLTTRANCVTTSATACCVAWNLLQELHCGPSMGPQRPYERRLQFVQHQPSDLQVELTSPVPKVMDHQSWGSLEHLEFDTAEMQKFSKTSRKRGPSTRPQ